MKKDHAVQVTLIVKSDSPADAQRIAETRLGVTVAKWFVEDAPSSLPYPEGSLLWYRFHAKDDKLAPEEYARFLAPFAPVGR